MKVQCFSKNVSRAMHKALLLASNTDEKLISINLSPFFKSIDLELDVAIQLQSLITEGESPSVKWTKAIMSFSQTSIELFNLVSVGTLAGFSTLLLGENDDMVNEGSNYCLF